MRLQHENPDIAGVSIVQFDRPFAGVGQVTRNTCIAAPGHSDRSPAGTGTCARRAVLHARGAMRVGDSLIGHPSSVRDRVLSTEMRRSHHRPKPHMRQPSEAREYERMSET